MTASPSLFFLLIAVLSVPFYLLGAAGGRLAGLPILPASALMTFTPMIAALILVYRQRGAVGAAALLGRVFELRRHRGMGWYLTALLFMPVICVLEFGALRLIGREVPLPRIAPSEAFLLFSAFFIGAIGEEVGWQGYAFPALRTRMSALAAAVVLGTVWAMWHVIPFVQLSRSTDWIFWHSLSAVALRIIIVWLFENTGRSTLVAVLFHTMLNVSWALFPNSGSHYDPFVTFVILSLVVGAIIARWGPSTLTRFGPQATNSSKKTPDIVPLSQPLDPRPTAR